MKVKIIRTGIHASDIRVFINDIEETRVTAFTINATVNNPLTLKLELVPDELEIENGEMGTIIPPIGTFTVHNAESFNEIFGFENESIRNLLERRVGE